MITVIPVWWVRRAPRERVGMVVMGTGRHGPSGDAGKGSGDNGRGLGRRLLEGSKRGLLGQNKSKSKTLQYITN